MGDMIMKVDVTKTVLSDHDQIEISKTGLRQLNFLHQDISWTQIRNTIEEIKWKEIFEGRCNEECTEIFIEIITQICISLIPKKFNKGKNKTPRERKKLIN